MLPTTPGTWPRRPWLLPSFSVPRAMIYNNNNIRTGWSAMKKNLQVGWSSVFWSLIYASHLHFFFPSCSWLQPANQVDCSVKDKWLYNCIIIIQCLSRFIAHYVRACRNDREDKTMLIGLDIGMAAWTAAPHHAATASPTPQCAASLSIASSVQTVLNKKKENDIKKTMCTYTY